MSDKNKKEIDSQIEREKKKNSGYQRGKDKGKGKDNGRGLRGMKYYIQNK